MAEAQELHARLDKMQLPVGRLELEVEFEGVFGFPEEWKATDQGNPGLFTYAAKFCTSQFTGGKIQPRKQTEREIREAEEAAKKKSGKKDGKADPVEEERLRKQKEADAEEDRKRQEQFDKLPQEEKAFFNSEDPYKSPSVRFEKNKEKVELVGGLLVIFEERAMFDKGEWIYLYKLPAVSEDELAKLRKAKPKNLNINDLNPLTMRAWIDYSKFVEGDAKQVRVRCPLKQIDETAETSKPNLQKSYVLVRLALNQKLVKDHDEQQLTSKDLIKPPPSQPPVPLDIQSVTELEEEIRLALESIAMEYSSAFWKELNFLEEQRNINTLAVPKKADVVKRKQQFLYDFNMTGKYRVLKERLKKAIVKVCKHKYAGVLGAATSFTGVTTEAKDQFYSQLYNFLVSSSQRMLERLVDEKKGELGVTTVPSVQRQSEIILAHVKQRLDEPPGQRAYRFASEYEDIRDIESAKEVYNKLLQQEPDNLELKKEYVKFCLRNRIGTTQKLLATVYECLRLDRDSAELQELYCYLLMATRKKAQCRQAWVLLNEMLNHQPGSVKLLTLCQFLFGVLIGDEQLGQKYAKLAERIRLREVAASLPKLGSHSTEPAASELPTMKGVCQYNLALKDQERDQLTLAVLREFAKYNMFGMVEALLPRIKHKESDEVALLNVRTELFKGNSKLALDMSIELFQRSASLSTAELISQVAFELKNYRLAEEYLKKCLKYPDVVKCPAVYLRLACLYAEDKKWGNSKACLVKLLQNDPNHCLGWLKLGLTELQLGQNETALNSLREANLLDPANAEVWLALAEAYSRMQRYTVANQCLIAYSRIESAVINQGTQRQSGSNRRQADQQHIERLRGTLSAEPAGDDQKEALSAMFRTLERLIEGSVE